MTTLRRNGPEAVSDHWNEKAFVTLLSDAIEHAFLATALPNPGSIQRLARSAIINSALSLESAANICISSLPMSARFVEDIERKFGTVEKFELFLTLHKRAGLFDRGCTSVQKIQDVISLRNDFVHPKSIRLPAQISKDECGPKNAMIAAGAYGSLQLIKSYRNWNGDSAISIVKAVCEFYDQFFRKWCSWEPEYTATVLSPSMVVDGKVLTSGVQGEIELFGKGQTLWSLPMDWIRFNVNASAGDAHPQGPQQLRSDADPLGESGRR